MEEKFEKIRRFLDACDGLISGTYREAEVGISQVLRALAESDDLKGLFNAVTEEFDYAQSRSFYLRDLPNGKGTVYLPSGRVDALAFVFCLLAEIDSGVVGFRDFLLRYFYVDGSYTASYALFADRIIRPFRDIVREAYPAACGAYSYRVSGQTAPSETLKEKTAQKNVVFEGKIITVRCDDAVLPNGKTCKRELVEHPGGAAVLCVTDGKAVLVRQFRYAYGEELYEIPAGKLEKGEDPSSAAKRELGEETGLIADSLTLLTVLYPSPGYTNEKIYIYEAADVRMGERHPDSDEFLNVEYVPFAEACNMIARGEIKDAKTVCALLYYRAKMQ